MAQIEIPFSHEMAIAAIEGRKIATTRSEKKGEIGDIFQIEDPVIHEANECDQGLVDFRLVEIKPIDLYSARYFFYRLEGFESAEEFEKVWRSLHRGHFTLDKTYYIHFFARVV